MDNRPIGVFDSGLGGLTVVRQLLRQMPAEDIVYFGDIGRVPYGNRSRETIEKYARQDCRFLEKKEVKQIIAACGTVSSTAPHVLEQASVPACGVVEATADGAAAASRNGKIGILGTAATIRSGAFTRRILASRPQAKTFPMACPLLIPLVEAGWISPDDEITRQIVRRYIAPLQEQGIDTLILGCTHFPLLAPILADELGEAVALIDPGRETAAAVARQLESRGAQSLARRIGTCRFYVSDRPDDFSRIAAMFLGRDIGDDVEQVDLDVLG